MASSKTPTERLDAMSVFFFGEDGKSGLMADIKELQARILPTADECDAVSVELGALYEKYATVRGDAREVRNSLHEIEDELRSIREPMAVMEAQASLDAFGLDPQTAKPFTAAQIKDRALIALASNEEYQKLDPGAPELAVMEAQARFDAGGFDPQTAKAFTVDQTKHRATIALGKNAEYKAITARKRKLEGDQARAKAVLTDCDAALSEYRNRNRALVARLGMLTARMGK